MCWVTSPGCVIVGSITLFYIGLQKVPFVMHIVNQIWFSIGVHLINCFYCDLVTVFAHNKGSNENSLNKQLIEWCLGYYKWWLKYYYNQSNFTCLEMTSLNLMEWEKWRNAGDSQYLNYNLIILIETYKTCIYVSDEMLAQKWYFITLEVYKIIWY